MEKTSAQWIAAAAAMMVAGVAPADDYVDTADANGDGYVSLYELRAAYYADPEFNERIERSFAAYDRDGDGLISAGERAAVRNEAAASAPAAVSRPGAEAANGQRDRQMSSSAGAAGNAPIAAPPAPAKPLSRSAAWIREIDTDNSGGASAAELLASGGSGQPWFSEAEFKAADRNKDGDLDPDELDALVRSLERRHR